jgi:hypothetical protein
MISKVHAIIIEVTCYDKIMTMQTPRCITQADFIYLCVHVLRLHVHTTQKQAETAYFLTVICTVACTL